MPQSSVEGLLSIRIEGEEFHLLAEKAIYWPKEKCLLIADLHIGKVTHFRKNNIPIPKRAAEKNFYLLEKLFVKHKPKKVYFLGDLFHSYYNKEWDQLCFTLAKYPKIRFELITGNHDILKEEHYHTAGILCLPEKKIGPFKLTHHPEVDPTLYNLCGHIHPGVRLRGNGRQSIKLPCFYFGAHQAILPAFGSFTGTAKLKIKEGDQVFAVMQDHLIKVSK